MLFFKSLEFLWSVDFSHSQFIEWNRIATVKIIAFSKIKGEKRLKGMRAIAKDIGKHDKMNIFIIKRGALNVKFKFKYNFLNISLVKVIILLYNKLIVQP